MRDVWPETTPQRHWCHKIANVLDKLCKRLRPRAKRALREYQSCWAVTQIPGLWDMHVHVGGLAGGTRAGPTFIAHGVTGVRDMGSPL